MHNAQERVDRLYFPGVMAAIEFWTVTRLYIAWPSNATLHRSQPMPMPVPKRWSPKGAAMFASSEAMGGCFSLATI